MPSRSCTSVKVTYFDQRAAREELRRAAEALVRRRPEIERVLLFGSLATGRAAPGSDADLLIIVGSSDRSFLDRIPLYTPEGCSVGVDVFPYTREEIEHMLASGNPFVRQALSEGVELLLPR
jgi:hypothetical protein